jgi:hypothetical protein
MNCNDSVIVTAEIDRKDDVELVMVNSVATKSVEGIQTLMLKILDHEN